MTPVLDDARMLNREGWTCGDEPGEYDRCTDCRAVCDDLAAFLGPYLARIRADAICSAAEEFASGAWADQFLVDRVHDDVSAVQATERWFQAHADALQREAQS